MRHHLSAEAFADGKVRVERVLLGALRRSGLADGEIALLVRDACLGSGTARRELGERAGTLLRHEIPVRSTSTSFPIQDGPHPIAIGTVEIGPGLGWSAGTLHDLRGAIPATLASAAVGRTLGFVLTHPDIDPTLVVHAPDSRGGVLRVHREVVEIRIPRGLPTRLRTWSMLISRHRTENGTTTRTRIVLAACACVNLACIATATPRFDGAVVSNILDAIIVAPTLPLAFLAIDAQMGGYLSGRLRDMFKPSATSNHLAYMRHLNRLGEAHRRRGFDDAGSPA